MDMTPSPFPAINVERLTKIVDNGGTPLTILHENTFSVANGETVAIIGASGSGKTTLLGMLAGLDIPSSGKIELDGNAIVPLNEDQRAKLRGELIGFVFQSFQLLPSLNALENVMLPLELNGTTGAKELAQSWLTRVGLAHRLLTSPRHLSGGEQQRVALARAFATNPRIILADEPTGNLDSATGKQIADLMFELNEAQGTTLVLVTHDESLASRCHRRLHMTAGILSEV